MFDALFILNEKLYARDINVQSWPLRWALHWGVKTAIVLTAPSVKQTNKHRHKARQKVLLLLSDKKTALFDLEQIAIKKLYWYSIFLPDQHLGQTLGVCRSTLEIREKGVHSDISIFF